MQTRQITGVVSMYERSRWIHPIPPMPTQRKRFCARSNKSVIIACGGLNDDNTSVNTVEIFLFITNQWHSGTPLPAPRAALQCTVIEERVYLMGGYYPSMNESMSTCFYTDYLASENLSEETTLIWKSLPDVPLPGCTSVNMNGILLAFGGDSGLNGVHFYDPLTQLWLRIGNLPEYREALVAATLPNGQIILSGGWNEQQERSGKTFIGDVKK